jgi:hypothetical protein
MADEQSGRSTAPMVAEPPRTRPIVRLRADHLATLIVAGLLTSLLLGATERMTGNMLRSWLGVNVGSVPQRGLETVLWCLLAIVAARSVPPSRAVSTSARWLLAAALLVQVIALSGELHGTGRGMTSDIWLVVPLLGSIALFGLARLLTPQRLLTILIAVLLPFVLMSLAAGWTGSEVAFLGDSSRLPGPGLAAGRLRGVFAHPLYLAAAGGLLLILSCARFMLLRSSVDPSSHRVAGASALVVTAASGAAAVVAADGLSAAQAVGAALAAVALSRLARPSQWSGAIQWILASAGGLGVALFPFVLGAFELGSLTGRVEVWSRILATLTPRERLVGLGADPMSRSRALFERLDTSWGALHAHSQSLDLFLEIGYLGPVVIGILVTLLVRAGLRLCAVSDGWSLAVTAYLVLLLLTDEVLTSRFLAHQVVALGILGLLFTWEVREARARRPEISASGSGPRSVSG